MKKKTVRKLELNKESLRQLAQEDVQEAVGGLTKFCTLGSCGMICP